MRFEDPFWRFPIEELHKMLHSLNLPPQPPPYQTIQARYWLVFLNEVKHPSFTADLVRDDNEDPIKVAIYNTYTESFISPNCFLSSAKVRLTVLNAEFWENKGETWSRSDFNQSVLSAREAVGPILKGGSLTIRLENGVGTFGNIVFNDNSCWTKRGFRLGVMIEGEGEEGHLNGERVREGVSKPFRVKDRRGKDCQKPIRLELKHKVQSLKNIGSGRASRLEKNNIKTVSDFLWWYHHKLLELRKILDIKSDYNKVWITMVEHAKECDNEFWASYNDFNNNTSRQPHEVSPLEEDLTWMNTFQDQFSNESEALVHPMGRNMSLYTNDGPCIVGSGSSQPNPHENDIIEGVEYSYSPGLAQPQLSDDQVSMDNFLAIIEDILQTPSRSDSFDTGPCEQLVQDYIASMVSSVYAGPPLTPRKNRKIKALLRSVAFLAVPRKRARIAPPANQTTVLAI